MNIKKIQQIVNEPLLDESTKRLMVIEIIADDLEAINSVLAILDVERRKKKELISNMNELLCKADVALDSPKINKDGFIQKEISELYSKWKGFISHLWK